MDYLVELGKRAKSASVFLRNLGENDKNEILKIAADALIDNADTIISANAKDMENANVNGIKESYKDRLLLTKERITEMAHGLRVLTELPDPLSEFASMKTLSNGLTIGQKRTAIGVVGIIYEARPNVTADVFGLCLKSGNACILRGGKEAIFSNISIVNIFQDALKNMGHEPYIVQLVEDTDRKTAEEMMRMKDYIDVLIPRGGKALIDSVILNSTIPVIETGVGNCHVYVDKYADLDMAVEILVNAKTHRPSVCNACETLLVHKEIANEFIPKACKALVEKGVEIRGDETFVGLYDGVKPATEEDYKTEFLELIISAKTVGSYEEAVSHISEYGTGHSEVIVTNDYQTSVRFHNDIDAAVVYVNASSRFTDGFQFGFGAEIGISTQKLHARGPMGLKELTTTKYVVSGNGQIRK